MRKLSILRFFERLFFFFVLRFVVKGVGSVVEVPIVRLWDASIVHSRTDVKGLSNGETESSLFPAVRSNRLAWFLALVRRKKDSERAMFPVT